MVNTDTLIVVEGESQALIHEELRTIEQRARLEQAVRDSVLKAGNSIDEVSAASGLRPMEIRRLLDRPPELEDIGVLAGVV